MNEKALIISERPNTKIFLIIMTIIAVLLAVAVFIPIFNNAYASIPQPSENQMSTYNRHKSKSSCGSYYHSWSWDKCTTCEQVTELLAKKPTLEAEAKKSAIVPAFGSFAVIMAIALLVKLFTTSFSLKITNMGVYCTTLWIHHAYIPIDSITTVARVGLLNILSIGAPAARITVLFLPDSETFYYILNKLLVERQEKALTPATNTDTTAV